ncbi:MAG: hypothetical protein KZQ66_01180, partial [Candidatus Thiodiazotropha sp. (ex Lucinoma aequizonata)]|nr:hypothetical protein [Candidatus Thiodiazotropha sp. (ex Lucinoma aequizonata)]
MRKNNVARDTISDPLTELLRTSAERLIYQAVEVELLELLAEHSERRTEDGKAGVRVIVKSGVYAFESSDDLINFCHLNTVFEFNS